MITNTRHKVLVMRLKDPSRVLSIVPTAKPFLYRGQELTVVPHGMTEYRLLKNLDLNPPHPVDTYYNWPGAFAPMATQRETVRFLTAHNRAYCLSGLGTGKTIASLWAFDFLREQGLAKRLLVVAPLSTMERTWGDEIFRHFPHLHFVTLHGTSDRRRMLLRNPAADVFIINHDGVKVIKEALVERTDIDTVAIDEIAQVARNAQTDRWKALKALIDKRERVWGLTGTPTPNAPTDAWAQCRLLTPSTVPTFFASFRDMTMRQTSTYSWAIRDEALDIVHQAMQPSIRFSRDECVDLPPVMYETREVPLSKDQQEAYDSMMSQLYAEFQGGTITAVNEAVKAMKLVQICCGSVRGDNDTIVTIPPKARVSALLDIIEEAPSKVIVFVPFKAALRALHAEVSKHHDAEMIYGEVSKNDRDRILGNFQKSTHPRVLIAQPAAMSHGLTLTAASVIVWFAPITSAETYEQANGRITRPGQVHNQLIMHIQGSRLEDRMYTRLTKKVALQGTLLDMFKEGYSA
jgi:SNF2 family DNA or RNA helicase